jgi:hypothetical protein
MHSTAKYSTIFGSLVIALTGYGSKAADSASSGASPDLIYVNGSILTMARPTPAYVEALAVKDGKISFVGSKNDALQWQCTRPGRIHLCGYGGADGAVRRGVDLSPDALRYS